VFEREIHTEVHRLLQRLNLPEPFLPLPTLLHLLEAEPPYQRYFWAEARWHLYEEHLLRQRHPHFDYSAPAIQTLLHQLDELLLRHARFPRRELEALVESAVKVRLNFLCRPRTTLKWFIFRGEPLKPCQEILHRLDYLSDYPYLLDGLRNHLQPLVTTPAEQASLSVLEFERIVQQVDSIVLEFTPAQFLQLLQPLEEFFALTNPEAKPLHLPTAALIIFLDDKGIHFLAQELEQLLRRQHLRWISHDHFLDLIDHLLATLETTSADTRTLPLEFPEEGNSHTSTPAQENPTAETPTAPAQSHDSPSDSAPPSAPLSAPAPQTTQEEAEICSDTPSPPPASAEPPPPPTAPSIIPDEETSTDTESLLLWFSQLSEPTPNDDVIWHDSSLSPDILQSPWKREFSRDEEVLSALPVPSPELTVPQSTSTESPESIATEPSPILAESTPEAPPSLARLLHDAAWLRRYSRGLFPSDDALTHTIHQLLQCPHWKAAAAVIDRSFALYGVDPSSRLAEQFRQDILHHYRPSDGGHALH